jgi:molecular chaperone GrpE
MIEEKGELTLEELKKKLEECQQLKEEYLAGWQRERADFLNYKKEEMERMGEMIKYADVGIILNFLPILDNFEIAEKKLSENLKVDELRSSSPFADARVNDENIKGLLQIKTQIQDFLKNQGVEEIDCLGKKFDPNSQEIVGEMGVKDKEPGTVIETIQKGYTINGRLLRPARVKVVK